jgi:hypothetical protein
MAVLKRSETHFAASAMILNSDAARSLARAMRRWDPGEMPIDGAAIEDLQAAGCNADRAYYALTGEEQIFWRGAPINALTASALLFALTLECPKAADGQHQISAGASSAPPFGRLPLQPGDAERPRSVCRHCGARGDVLRRVTSWARAQRA